MLSSMTITDETTDIRIMARLCEPSENTDAALSIGRETAALHPNSVLEEPAPGVFKLTNGSLTARFYSSISVFKVPAGDGREIDVLGLFPRLKEVPAGQSIAL
jgi:hypothetical protein